MIMIAEFYESWRGIRKNARGKLSLDQAKQFHQKEKPYVVIISKNKAPVYIVKINFNYEGYFCSIAYLNENLDAKKSESYVAQEHQLFLKNVQKKYYDGREIDMVTYLYETDGRYRKNFFIDGRAMEDAEYGKCDVSSHFREMIQFGNYDSILPEEAKRGLQEG
ncbi:hypothetical protein SAMN04488112_11483 [Melghirimyces thermohalophilus]|uniref:Uncharacterized protein n=2 Tax=Melghirimyces thermohalophilus TaxID=1236220 RepID=A0A1G6NWQ6_9BACL|nr:hypothetical protein SAMN04488112_11483 [Melghirimyces thermohalophilus]